MIVLSSGLLLVKQMFPKVLIYINFFICRYLFDHKVFILITNAEDKKISKMKEALNMYRLEFKA